MTAPPLLIHCSCYLTVASAAGQRRNHVSLPRRLYPQLVSDSRQGSRYRFASKAAQDEARTNRVAFSTVAAGCWKVHALARDMCDRVEMEQVGV